MTNVTDLKLTDNQSLTLTYLAAATQEGLYLAEDGTFGVWFDSLNNDLVGTVPTKAQAKASLNQLVKKRIFEADVTQEEGSTWLTLTPLGQEALEAFGDSPEEDEDAPVEEAAADAPEEEAPAAEEDDEDLLGDVTDEAPEEEEEDLLGDVADLISAEDFIGGVEATIAVHTDHDSITTEQVISHTENYTVNEWKDDSGTEWAETIFADGSRTLKRRRLVSESWRTDYWGAEFKGDKERATTAKLAKLARVNGHFTHNPLPAAA